MAKNQNYDVNYKLRQMILNAQGGGSMADLSDILQRIAALEENKQDKITAGQGILISGNNIAAQNIIDDTRNSSTTVWSSNKVKSLVESFEGGVNVVLTSSRPSKSEAIEKTMYYVGDSAPYHIWFFLENNYIDFGTTEISLENYYTKLEVDNLLEFKVDKEEDKVLISLEDLAQITENKNDIIVLNSSKVDKEEGKTLISSEDLSQISLNKLSISNLSNQKVDKVSGKSLISDININQITTNKNDITDLKSNVGTKQDKITDSALSSISDSTTVSSVSASGKTNKTFTLSKLWTYIKGKITATYYPVGSVVLNMGTNPSTNFGGTWELLATGTKALYLDSTAGTTITEELPNPSITIGNTGKKTVDFKGIKGFAYKSGGKSDVWGMDYGTHELYEQASFDSVETASNHSHTVTVGNSVYKNSGKVRAEGITVCAWKRTA